MHQPHPDGTGLVTLAAQNWLTLPLPGWPPLHTHRSITLLALSASDCPIQAACIHAYTGCTWHLSAQRSCKLAPPPTPRTRLHPSCCRSHPPLPHLLVTVPPCQHPPSCPQPTCRSGGCCCCAPPAGPPLHSVHACCLSLLLLPSSCCPACCQPAKAHNWLHYHPASMPQCQPAVSAVALQPVPIKPAAKGWQSQWDTSHASAHIRKAWLVR